MTENRQSQAGPPNRRFKRWAASMPVNVWAIMAIVVFSGLIGTWLLAGSHAATPTSSVQAENGSVSTAASSITDATASGGAAIKFGSGATGLGGSGNFPDATNRPHMISGTIMAYTDASGAAQTITLKSLPAKDSYFGTNPNGQANNCAHYRADGFVEVVADNCVIDGYNFDGVATGQIWANNVTISRNWFHNIDGQDNWAVWVHAHGTYSGLTITDNIVQGSSSTKTGPDGILKADGDTSHIVIERNHSFNNSSFVQFTPIAGSGTTPYGNIVADNYLEVISDPSNYGLHLEQINVSSGTGACSFSITILPVLSAKLLPSTCVMMRAMLATSQLIIIYSMVNLKTPYTVAIPAQLMEI